MVRDFKAIAFAASEGVNIINRLGAWPDVPSPAHFLVSVRTLECYSGCRNCYYETWLDRDY